MRQRRFSDADALLNNLLNRFESGSGTTGLLAYIDDEGFVDIEAYDRCIARLKDAEQSGGVTLKYRMIDGSPELVHVRLADTDAVYHILGRTSSTCAMANALQELRLRTAHSAALSPIVADVHKAWSRGVASLTLAPGSVPDLQASISLAEALAARATTAEPGQIDYRSFSSAAVGDSKALQRLLSPTAEILRALLSVDDLRRELPADEMVAAFGVLRLPQPFLLSGPIAFDSAEIARVGYVGFPPEDVERIGLVRPVAYVLTIENFTSFVRHAREVNTHGSGLAIYTGGFPARAILAGIVLLAIRAAAPVYHWGDIDPGGLRIFRHLEMALAEHNTPLRPHLMDRALLARLGQQARDRKRDVLRDVGAQSGIADLWTLFSGPGPHMVLEQEAIDPSNPTGIS